MFRSLSIKNFRGFREFELAPLGRVNLIGGRNNTGKTAVLEAAFMLIGPSSPETSLRLRVARGFEQIVADTEELWGWLFYAKRFDQAIELATTDDLGRHVLAIRLVEPSSTVLAMGDGNEGPSPSEQMTTGDIARELRLDYHGPQGERSTSSASLAPNGVKFEHSAVRRSLMPSGAYFGASSVRGAKTGVELFSRLAGVGREGEILGPVQILEPRLRRIEVLYTAGAPVLHGDLGIGRLVPIPMMGEGVVRVLTFALAIATSPKGLVLIDEIENGLHASVLESVWRALWEAARRAEVQLIATTHSWECIEAAQRVFHGADEAEFVYHRLERTGEDVRSVAFDRESMETSVEMHLEVR